MVVREEWPASWVENNPAMRFLKDGQRFLWASNRNGWKNYDLYNLDGKQARRGHQAMGSRPRASCGSTKRPGVLDYTSHDGDNPIKLQLHRVGLDGTGDKRLTDPAFTHSVDFAPDGKHFIDVAQTHDTPPSTRLVNADGKVLDTSRRAT